MSAEVALQNSADAAGLADLKQRAAILLTRGDLEETRSLIDTAIADLPEDHPVRRYGEEKMELLDRLGYASSKAEEGPREPRSKPGWREIPSSAPADEPLPR